MTSANQWHILRGFLYVEENLHALKDGVDKFAAGDETEEVKAIDKLIDDTRNVRAMLERFFAP